MSQSIDPFDAPAPAAVGRLLHASLAVSDLDAAGAFLSAALGFRHDFVASDLTDEVARLTRRPGLAVRLARLSRPGCGCPIELIEFREGGSPPPDAVSDGGPPRAHLAFAAADLKAAMAALCAAGAEPLGAVVAFPEGRCVYLRAPGGIVVELEETGASAFSPGGAP